MIHISLPNTEAGKTRRLSFYLAMEEYVARELKQYEECFFMWQVEPTVIFGRNQLIESEVNLDYCKAHNIDTIRRKSGGGCVYADMNNVMFSYINTGWDVTTTFDHYIQKTAEMLRSLGVDAKGSSRNDIMIDGRKVSGNAFYHIPGRNIVHGTMLYDTDMQNMVASITPSDQKLVSKGVESVRQHVCLLKDYIGERMDVNQFKEYVRKYMCNKEYILTEEDVRQIELMQEEYHSEEYIYGRNPKYTIERNKRIEGVGEFKVQIELKNNTIYNVNILGDFFLVGDLNQMLIMLKKVPYSINSISNALENVDPAKVVMKLSKEQLISLLIDTED